MRVSQGFNNYLDQLGFSECNRFFLDNGVEKQFKRKAYISLQGETALKLGFIKSGGVRYTRVDNEGREHIVGYSFAEDYACDYTSFIHQKPAQVNIQAIQNTVLYELTYVQTMEFFNQHLLMRAKIGEEFAAMVYDRLLNFYCETPEERYLSLLKRCPDLLNFITLKEIASFIGVTPETLSHIRRKLLTDYHLTDKR